MHMEPEYAFVKTTQRKPQTLLVTFDIYSVQTLLVRFYNKTTEVLSWWHTLLEWAMQAIYDL